MNYRGKVFLVRDLLGLWTLLLGDFLWEQQKFSNRGILNKQDYNIVQLVITAIYEMHHCEKQQSFQTN